MSSLFRSAGLVVLVGTASCGSAENSSPADSGPDTADVASTDAAETISPARTVTIGDSPFEKDGAFGVGQTTLVLEDKARSRKLTTTAWWPASKPPASPKNSLTTLELGANKAKLETLLAAAPGCVRKTHSGIQDAPYAPSALAPVIVFSHCSGCVRFSSFTIAERLASHGFIVVAPDHEGGTMYDAVPAAVGKAFLATRVADVRFVLDQVLGGTILPIAGKLNPDSIGVFGHSFGGATTGGVLAVDPRTKAGLSIAAPMESDVLPPTKMADIKQPILFLLAREDNSITQIGNRIIEDNAKKGNPPTWLVDVADAGHWSFSDIAGLTKSFAAGCGEDARQTDRGELFTYLENVGARSLAAAYVTAFFSGQLRGDPAGTAFVGGKHPEDLVNVTVRK